MTLTGSIMSSNRAKIGGAINNENGTLTVTSSTFTNNTAPESGAWDF